VIKVNPHLIY